MRVRNGVFATFVAVAMVGFWGSGAFAAEERKVSVSGTCTHSVVPDRGAIVLVAEFVDRDLQVATKKAGEAYDRVREGVKRLSLESLELKTVEYSLGELKEWEKNRTVSKGYRARLGIKVTTSATQRLGEVIALAAKEGLRDVGQLTLFLSDEKNTREQAACLQEAAENARAKAEKLAGALSARVGQIISINETNVSSPGFPPEAAMMAAAPNMDSARMAPPNIEAGQQRISVSVQAVFSLR